MCTTDEDKVDDIQTTMDALEAVLLDVVDFSNDIDVQIDACSMLVSGPVGVIGWLSIGDYEIHLELDEKITWSYRPKVIKGGGYDTSLYQDGIDRSRIVSFTMPPAKDGERS